jgi:DNA mismatch repair protein MutS2
LVPLGGLPEAMNRLSDDSQIEEVARIKDELWTTVKALETGVNEQVEAAMNDAKMALSGAELLEALADGTAFQRKLREATGHVIQEAMQQAREHLAAFLQPASLRCPFDIFTTSWPAKVDRQTIDGIDAALDSKLKAETTDHLVEMARLLGPMKAPCEQAVARLVETDQWLAVARWAHENRCVMPELVKHGVWLENGRHLLLGVEPDPVTYGLGEAAIKADRQSLALLTGANSGGKTTLLECIAYAAILAHMGLPVPATSARIGQVDALHILAKAGGTQSAGALEQTLVELATVVSDPTPKLILADELEAITEPGAGARIIAGMLLAAESQPETTMMLVTHLAPAILEATGRDDLRVDGIEARGLGDDLELLVDRTPRRNHLARSTPELIVKRLVEKSNGHAKALFADILEMFHQRD